MSKRYSMSKGHSKKYFSKTAGHRHVHPKNMMSSGSYVSGPMRGGIRL